MLVGAGLAEMFSRRLFQMPRVSRLQGVSLVEVMVSVAILGVLLSVAIPSLANMMERRRVTAVALEVASILTTARSEANFALDSVVAHMEDDPNNLVSCVAIHVQHGSDSACKCYNPVNDMCGGTPIPILRDFRVNKADGVSFEATADHWGVYGKRITFAKNQYLSNISGVKVLVSGARTGAQLRVEINDAYRIRTCSPNGSIGGFPAC